MANKRNRSDSRVHTPCRRCDHRVHGERGFRMHLVQVHDVKAEQAAAEAKLAAKPLKGAADAT